MKYLIFCSCGHSLEHHGSEGCGAPGFGCSCRRDTAAALESAVDIANADALAAWQSASGVNDVESA